MYVWEVPKNGTWDRGGGGGRDFDNFFVILR